MTTTAPATPATDLELLAPAGTLAAFEAALEAGLAEIVRDWRDGLPRSPP